MQLWAAAWRCLITPGMLAALRHFVQGLIVITLNQDLDGQIEDEEECAEER